MKHCICMIQKKMKCFFTFESKKYESEEVEL